MRTDWCGFCDQRSTNYSKDWVRKQARMSSNSNQSCWRVKGAAGRVVIDPLRTLIVSHKLTRYSLEVVCPFPVLNCVNNGGLASRVFSSLRRPPMLHVVPCRPLHWTQYSVCFVCLFACLLYCFTAHAKSA